MPAELVAPVAETTELDRVADHGSVPADEIARALEVICRDSQVHPHRYLQETTVPHGGE
jgi:hypothetical protein